MTSSVPTASPAKRRKHSTGQGPWESRSEMMDSPGATLFPPLSSTPGGLTGLPCPLSLLSNCLHSLPFSPFTHFSLFLLVVCLEQSVFFHKREWKQAHFLLRGYREGDRWRTYLKLTITQGHVKNALKYGGITRAVLHFLKGLYCFEGTSSEYRREHRKI